MDIIGHPIWEVVVWGTNGLQDSERLQIRSIATGCINRLRWYDCNLRINAEELAIIFKRRHPDWTDKKISAAIGINSKSLYRLKGFKTVKKAAASHLGERMAKYPETGLRSRRKQ